MLETINFTDVLFLDIETVPQHDSFDQLNDIEKELFSKKTAYQRQQKEVSEQDFYEHAGIWAEFGKIVCISVGFFSVTNGINQLRIKSSHFNHQNHLLCAHNGKEFDFPYIARRMVILGLPIPEKLNLFGKKPWEVAHLDTMDLWKFGDYKHFTSLKLLTHILGIPSPKEDIDGSQVAQVFYEDKNIERIVAYCERDVVAIAQILLRFKNLPLLEDKDVLLVKD